MIHRARIILFCCMVSSILQASNFNTLADFVAYAQKYPSDPQVDNEDLLNPDFTSFLREHTPSWFGRMLYRFKLTHPVWTAETFQTLLQAVTAQRVSSGYKGRFVLAYAPKQGEEFYIWGGLRGSYHSFVRCLQELNAQGILSENLEVKPGSYFVFNGNAINQSAHILPTLTVVLQLMKKNPDQVFYILGQGEDLQRWKHSGLADELSIRARAISSEEIPLSSTIASFFDTLPLALYLQGVLDNTQVGVVRISSYDRSFKELQEKKIASFLNTMQSSFKLQSISPDGLESGQVNLQAIVRGLTRDVSYEPTQGLVSLGKNNGVMEWNIFSSPTTTYQRLQNFYNDAYVKLSIGKSFNEWDITLFKQDMRALKGFEASTTFNLVTGYTKKNNKLVCISQSLFALVRQWIFLRDYKRKAVILKV